MTQSDFLSKVARICEQNARLGYKPVSYAIGDGVMIVADSKGEYDTYFDLEVWEYKFPKIWEGLTQDGIGILPSTGTTQSIKSFGDAMFYAVAQLKPKDRAAQFYKEPQLIES